MIIGIDFDGTCVTHAFPDLGKDIRAIPVLKKLVDNGHQLILYTMRSDEYLEEAVQWFSDNKIPLWGINENPQQKEWTNSTKVYCHLYIDDAALGIPLMNIEFMSKRPFVDWSKVEDLLIEKGFIV